MGCQFTDWHLRCTGDRVSAGHWGGQAAEKVQRLAQAAQGGPRHHGSAEDGKSARRLEGQRYELVRGTSQRRRGALEVYWAGSPSRLSASLRTLRRETAARGGRRRGSVHRREGRVVRCWSRERGACGVDERGLQYQGRQQRCACVTASCVWECWPLSQGCQTIAYIGMLAWCCAQAGTSGRGRQIAGGWHSALATVEALPGDGTQRSRQLRPCLESGCPPRPTYATQPQLYTIHAR